MKMLILFFEKAEKEKLDIKVKNEKTISTSGTTRKLCKILDRRINEIEAGTAELISWETIQAKFKLFIKTGKRQN